MCAAISIFPVKADDNMSIMFQKMSALFWAFFKSSTPYAEHVLLFCKKRGHLGRLLTTQMALLLNASNGQAKRQNTANTCVPIEASFSN